MLTLQRFRGTVAAQGFYATEFFVFPVFVSSSPSSMVLPNFVQGLLFLLLPEESPRDSGRPLTRHSFFLLLLLFFGRCVDFDVVCGVWVGRWVGREEGGEKGWVGEGGA